MLGLLLIYFIGKRFYQLAFEHDKNCWGYAILGVVTYYGITFLSGFIIAYFYFEFNNTSLENGAEFGLTLLSIPFGILGAYILYKKLEKKWRQARQSSFSNDILDQGLL